MKIAITHSTTACVLLKIGPLRILTDPVFDTGIKEYLLGPAAHATRQIGPAIAPIAIPPLDVLLLSHAHHLDNLDDAAARRRTKHHRRLTTGREVLFADRS